MRKLAIGLLSGIAGFAFLTSVFVASLPTKKSIAASDSNVIAQYDFSDGANIGADSSGNGYSLKRYDVDSNTSASAKLEGENGFKFDGKTVLYAPGLETDETGYDFMDNYENTPFTLSIDFKVDSDVEVDSAGHAVNSIYRIPIITIWGHMYTSNFDTNYNGNANHRASALCIDQIDKQANGFSLRFSYCDSYVGQDDNGNDVEKVNGLDWGYLAGNVSGMVNYDSGWTYRQNLALDTWHTFTFQWTPSKKVMTGKLNGEEYFSVKINYGLTQNEVGEWVENASSLFSNETARFTLGGYYLDPLTGGRGITANEGNPQQYAGFKGAIRNVSITKTGNVISYFTDPTNVEGVNDSNYALSLTTKRQSTDAVDYNVPQYDAEKKAWLLNRQAQLYAPTRESDGYDFMDDFIDKNFSISTTFMLPKTLDDSQVADGRGILFSLWGAWDGPDYGAGDNSDITDTNLLSSVVCYDSYASGAVNTNLRFGFLQDVEGSDDVPRTGWWAVNYMPISTDVFHNLTFSYEGTTETKHVTVFVDGVKIWEYDISSSQQFKHTKTQFSIGGAFGVGTANSEHPEYNSDYYGVSPNGSCAYFRSFDIYYDITLTDAQLQDTSFSELSSLGANEKFNSLSKTISQNFTNKGASVRMTSSTGLRFGYEINVGGIEECVSRLNATILDYGVLIMPEALLGSNELTVNTTDVLNLTVTKWMYSYSNSVGSSAKLFTGVVDYIPDAGIAQNLVSRAYVKYEYNGQTYYAYGVTITRSVIQVVNTALTDTKESQEGEYVNQVTFDGKTCWSKYKQNQIEILVSLRDRNNAE